MSEQSANSKDSAHYGWQHPPLAANTVSGAVSGDSVAIHTLGNDLCPECGEPVNARAQSCPSCGENLARAPKLIRCMYCRTTASSELVVCPGCGRELRESQPKLLLLGVPALLGLLLVILLISQWERVSPIAWARTNLARGVAVVENISTSIEPEMVIVMTPIVLEAADGVTDGTTDGDTANAVVVPPAESITGTETVAESLVTPVPDPNASQSRESVLAAAAMPTAPGGIGGLQAESENVNSDADDPAAVAPSDQVQPAAGGMAASLAAAEATSTPTATAVAAEGGTQPAEAAPVEEAVGGIAQAAVPEAEDTALPTPLPTASPTPTAVVTPLPTATPTPVVYQVRAGDTLVTIAAEYEVDVDELMAANQIGAQEVFAIQPGQMLIIPVPEPEPGVVVAGGPATMRLSAPALLIPPPDATVGCATGGTLIWERVQFVKDSDRYVLHLGFVSGQSGAGQEDVTWVVAQSSPVTQTEWKLDTALCDLAPASLDQQWRWWVEVVEEQNGSVIAVSPPSEIRSFTWR